MFEPILEVMRFWLMSLIRKGVRWIGAQWDLFPFTVTVCGWWVHVRRSCPQSGLSADRRWCQSATVLPKNARIYTSWYVHCTNDMIYPCYDNKFKHTEEYFNIFCKNLLVQNLYQSLQKLMAWPNFYWSKATGSAHWVLTSKKRKKCK